MTLFFPDLNVWIALSVAGHSHSAEAWTWLGLLPRDSLLIFSRYTQIGLLTNQAVMGEQTLTLQQAWAVYERWLNDPRVEFYPEPQGVDVAFRAATEPLETQPATKWIGDAYLLAYAKESAAALVMFDKALYGFARKHDYAAAVPA